MGGAGHTVTHLLRAWRAGDQDALHELMPMVYAELRRLAADFMRGERAEHTLRATDLLGEAYLRLVESDADWNDRVHFFAIAARTMRRILVDHARKHASAKRGAGQRALELRDTLVGAADAEPDAMLALDEALETLAKQDERKARVIELHYFGGLKQDEVALALGIHVNTVARDLRFAEAWLQQHLGASA